MWPRCINRRKVSLPLSHALTYVVPLLIVMCIYSSNCESSNSEMVSTKDNVGDDAKKKPETVIRLVRFSHQLCNESTEYLVQLQDFRLFSDITSRKPVVTLSVAGELLSDLDGPLEADLHISARMGSFWVPVPCISKRGSCHYEDICEMASQFSCPQQLRDQGLPCECPMKKGKFSVSNMSFELPSTSKSGAFIIVANIMRGNDSVLCQEMFAKFKSFTFTLEDEDD